IGIKDPNSTGFRLHYRDIGDYLSAEDKLNIVDSSSIKSIEWSNIKPNEHGDWLNQRSEDFTTWPKIGSKKPEKSTVIFRQFSSGLKSGRDSWAYAQTKQALISNLERLVATYNDAGKLFDGWRTAKGINTARESDVNNFLREHPEFLDSKRISWNKTLKDFICKQLPLTVLPERIYRSLYRPFTSQYAYFHGDLNDRTYQLPVIFPSTHHSNIGFYIPAASSASREF